MMPYRYPDDDPDGGFPGGGGPNHNRHYEDNDNNNPVNSKAQLLVHNVEKLLGFINKYKDLI